MKIHSIVNIGTSGFPYLKSAPVHKTLFINKILMEAGFKTIALNNEALLTGPKNEAYTLFGRYENVAFHTTVNTLYQPSSWIKKRLLRYLGLLNEFFFLFKYKSKEGIDAVILLTNGSFLRLIHYRILSIGLRFKLILIYHEYRSDFDFRKKKLRLRINDKLFDRYFPLFVDAVLPISEFLIHHVKTISFFKPVLKLPPLVDFSLFINQKINTVPYFLYCGSAGYIDAFEFIVKAFEKTSISDFRLYLVIGGSEKQMKSINDKIQQSPKKNFVQLYSDLGFDELISLYLNATALLIPLKPDIRDAARFPQKIAEYAASGNPIISTNFGEVKHYFKDGVNALLAADYEETMFAEKMDFVISNPEKSKEIGFAGKIVGNEHFNYQTYVDKLKSFIMDLA